MQTNERCLSVLFSVFLMVFIPLRLAAEHANSLEALAEGREATRWLGPEVLDPARTGIGASLPDLSLHTVDGGLRRLYAASGTAATVIVVRDPECPVSRRYGPRLAHLAKQYAKAGVGFIFIYPSEQLPADRRRRDVALLNAPGFYVEKGSFALADALGVESTGDVFVLDAEHHLRFRGAVDDQFGLGYTKDIATRHFLRDAIDAVLRGEAVRTPATSAPGCLIDADPEKDRQFDFLKDGQMLS